jgi:predicted metal-dependent HD superfamily phosphohydrolase
MNIQAAETFILEKLKNELPTNLYYHSFNHVIDVLNAAIQYAEMEKISENDTLLLKTAALFHDSGFTIQSENHEELGCDIAKKFLPQFDYKESDIHIICGMIMATKIPQKPNNILEKIICDADLDYLGRDDFWEIGHNLYKELEVFGILTNEVDWNRLQLKFLSTHQYFTQSAKALRKNKKEAHTKKIRDIVEMYAS